MSRITKIVLLSTAAILLLGAIAISAPLILNEIKYMSGVPKEWQEISIEHIGTVKIPNEWFFYQDGTSVFFTDQEYSSEVDLTIIAVGTISIPNDPYTSISDIFPNVIVGDVKQNDSRYSDGAVLSNSAGFMIRYYTIDGATQEKVTLSFYSHTGATLSLAAWNDLADDDTMRNIGKSYSTAE